LFSKFQSGRYEPGIDFSTDYHVFALDWLKDKPIWLVDGVPVKQTYYKWGDAPATLMVSNQIGLSLPGVDVSAMEHEDRDWDFGIKYIRVWRRTGNLGD
jgi:beta-glucanase (GH16 family)